MAGFQPDIPEQADQFLELRGQHAAGRLGQEDQQIDVGGRVQFASAVATDGNQRQRSRQVQFSPEFAEDFVDQLAALAQQAGSVAIGDELFADRPLPILQAVLQATRSEHAAGRTAVFIALCRLVPLDSAQEGYQGGRRQPAPGQPGPVPDAASHQQPGPGKQRVGRQALLFEQIEQDL